MDLCSTSAGKKMFPFHSRRSAQLIRLDAPMNVFVSLTNTKGLSNKAGENNCFLNSTVQVLWHLDAFRKNFNLLSHHACLEDSCIFCALKVIFTQFQFSDEKVLPPNALREALAVAFKDQRRFQLHLMDDAAECFENILTRIHFHLSNGNTDDNCTLEHCIPHQKFAMTVIEQVVCECEATSEPLPFVEFVHYVTARAIISSSQQSGTGVSFSETLRLAHSNGSQHNKCPGKCSGQASLNRTLTNIPDVISIGLVWDSDRQSAEQVKRFVEAIGTRLELMNMFDHVFDVEMAKAVEHKLVGMVCYYGRHYSAFFLHSKSNCWMSCDDATVTDLGSDWQNVVEKCCKGRYQPLLLLYQNPASKCISTKSAPTKTTNLTDVQNTESDLRDFENSNNSCSNKTQPTTCDCTSTIVPSAPLTSVSLSMPLMKKPAVNTQLGVGGYQIPGTNCPPSSFQSDAKELFSGNVPVGTSSYHHTHWMPHAYPFPPNLLPNHLVPAGTYPSNRTMASVDALSGPAPYGTAQQGNMSSYQYVVSPAFAQHPYQLPPQSVVLTPPSSQSFAQYGQYNGLPFHDSRAHGANLSVVPVPFSETKGNQSFDRAYAEPYFRTDSHSNKKCQSDGVLHVPRYDVPTRSPELNPLEWSIIDKDSLLSSPETAFFGAPSSGLTKSDSTSTLYDNLNDFSIISFGDRMVSEGTNPHVPLPNSLSPLSTSLTENYYIVPKGDSFDGFMDFEKFRDLVTEADQLMMQSEEKEHSGDLQAALICCNQANNLYATSRKQLSNAKKLPAFSDEVELKQSRSFHRSGLLSNQIEINQQKSKSNVQNKSRANIVVSNRLPSCEISNEANNAQSNSDLILLDEREPPNSKYRVLKDRLPHLYTQKYVAHSNKVHK